MSVKHDEAFSSEEQQLVDQLRKGPQLRMEATTVSRLEQWLRAELRIQPVRQPRRRNFFGSRQLAFAFASIILAVVLLGSGTVVAGEDSLPGNSLYPVKRTVEQARLSLASSQNRAALRTQFAYRRLAELETLAQQGDDIPPELLEDLADTTEAAFSDAAEAPPEQQAVLMEQLLDLTSRQQVVLETVTAKVPAQAKEALEHAQTVSQQGLQRALEALNDNISAPPLSSDSAAEEGTPVPEQTQAPGQEKTPPGQVKTPAGQEKTPPGQGNNGGGGNGNNGGGNNSGGGNKKP